MSEFLGKIMEDAINGIVEEDGYSEPIWKTVLLLPIRFFLIPILLFVFAVLLFLDSIGLF